MTERSDPFACTLDEDGARARLAQTHELTSRLRRRERVDQRLVLTFVDDGPTRTLVDDFVRAEQQCCSFFEFAVRQHDDEVVLELAAPEEAAHMLDAAMVAFDPTLGDDERLALHRDHAAGLAGPVDQDGGCGC